MNSKGTFKESSPWAQLIMLIAISILGGIVFSTIGMVIVIVQMLLTPDGIIELQSQLMTHPSYMREMQLFASLGMFVFPAFACAYLFSDNYKEYLSFKKGTPGSVFLLTIIGGVILLPFINFTYMLNQQMIFPEWLSGVEEWMRTMDERNTKAIEQMLYAENIGAFIMNLIVIAVLAGIGEELIFRGVGQNIVQRIFNNPHLTIWIVAFIFSAIHLQFYGFLPRFILGAYLGYLLYFTKNIWIPILAHFVNNAISVISFYIYQDNLEQMEEMDALGWGDTWWLAFVSVILFGFVLMQIKKLSRI